MKKSTFAFIIIIPISHSSQAQNKVGFSYV
jgi:hypothetical protein